jgi:hypothetical protein
MDSVNIHNHKSDESQSQSSHGTGIKIENNENINGNNNSPNSLHENLKKRDILLRFIVVLLIGTFWIIYRMFYMNDHKSSWDYKYCFKDKILIKGLGDVTNYISQNLNLRDFLLISGSNLLDIFFLSFLIAFVKMGTSWRAITNFILFFGIRNLCVQSLILLEYYDTYLFQDPGFPSIVVPFQRAPDFFYSGHAGSAMILALQFEILGYVHLKYFGIFLSFYEGFVMMVTRTHYSIDVIFGMLMAHYTFFLSKPIAEFLDYHVPFCAPSNHEPTKKVEDKNFHQVYENTN